MARHKESRGNRRGGRRRRAKPTWCILGRSRDEMTRRFGQPETRSDRVLVWTDPKGPAEGTNVECLMTADGRVHTARIVPPAPRRMSRDELLRWIGRYNGGRVERPEDARHELAGGAGALCFQGDYWAFPQRDPLGNIYGIKIWREPLEETPHEG